ncbi:peptide deformylase [Chitinibacter sp. GC72]|uniref:peptide deformylase n=1 Tax=Chitinibacter sp. GC72 TaxID=1526917 RepID=UPI0012FA8651|nr:peptide deformylase [Chitinibacter sp. GC72]
MAVRTILKMGDPRLLRLAQPVATVDTSQLAQPATTFATSEQTQPIVAFNTPALAQLITDLFDTMRASGGVGIAAPQIGVDLQVVIFGFTHSERYPDAQAVPETVLINPVITPLDDEEVLGWEGCLSVPGLRGEVPRYARIRYQGFDQYGNRIDRSVEGFHARVVQHECDHLWGVLYPQRISDMTRFGYTDVLFPKRMD